MTDDRWWKDFESVVTAAIPAGSRVLDVGCGEGSFVHRLGALGFDALGVDPQAPNHPRLVQQEVEDAIGLEGFDAITAVMALHHADLEAVVPTMANILRPGGRLFVYEFGWDYYDQRTADWVGAHDSSGGRSIAEWRDEHSDLHTISAIRSALSVGFQPTLEVRRPYLARMLARHDLEGEEHALIDAQLLPALGRWFIGRRAS